MSRTISEKQKRAMAEGRRRKEAARQAKRVAEAAERVSAYRAWVRRDAEITSARNAGRMLPREPMPPVTSDDFKRVRGEEDIDDE